VLLGHLPKGGGLGEREAGERRAGEVKIGWGEMELLPCGHSSKSFIFTV